MSFVLGVIVGAAAGVAIYVVRDHTDWKIR